MEVKGVDQSILVRLIHAQIHSHKVAIEYGEETDQQQIIIHNEGAIAALENVLEIIQQEQKIRGGFIDAN